MAKTKNPSSAPTKGPGKGATKRLSAEEHAAIRRAKKASQNANARAAASHKQETGGTFIEGLRQDRIEEREEAKRRRQERHEIWLFDMRNRRMQQAFIAADSPVLAELTRDTTADLMARAIILKYPTAEPVCDSYGNVLNSSFCEAVKMARTELSRQDRNRKGAVNKGIYVAKEALKRADVELKSQGK